MDNFENIQKLVTSYKALLVVVSKMQALKKLQYIYDKGHRVFAENKPQELALKYDLLPKDLEWHLIGHLQRNKVKKIAPFVKLIHSVDSFELAFEINKWALHYNRVIDILLQIKITNEETKHGFLPSDLLWSLNNEDWNQLGSIRICGVMGIGSLDADLGNRRSEFKKLTQYFREIKSNKFYNNLSFKEISMGMSDDYKIALEEGATIVRIGSAIFSDIHI